MLRTSLEDSWAAAFFYVSILASAALVIFPTLRALPASKPVICIMTLGMCVVMVRRESKRRTLGLTIQQIYAQAKSGRKFAPPAIELAAMVMWIWAMVLTF